MKRSCGRATRARLREIAEDAGVHHSTVVRSLGAKGKPFDLHHPEQEPAPDPFADFRVSQSPTGQRWHRALEALRAVNAQAEVSAMFDDRYTRIDHAIEPELRRAHAWINELHRRFFDV
jgi:hypothetical protein